MPDGVRAASEDLSSLHALLAQFAAIGATGEGGVSRLAASAEDGQARDSLCDWFRRQGLQVAVDRVGNLFGYLDFGEFAGSGAIYCGSHLDSQPDGGRFDGAYGVIAACCVARTVSRLVEAGHLRPRRRYLVVASWTNEEGARFQPSLLGSSVFAGGLDAERALGACDAEGITLERALDEIGYLGEEAPPAEPDCYVELHVEQGAILESQGRQIGFVTHCWGARKLRVRFLGRADHTGPTPMADRRDALRAASLLIAEISKRALASEGRLHGSVGRIEVEPNSPNVVPRAATLFVELRGGNESDLDKAEDWLRQAVGHIGEATGCQGEIEDSTKRAVQAFDPRGVEIARNAVEPLGLESMTLATIAGHDALALQSRFPSILLFVPSVGGVSHSPAELTHEADLEAGFRALLAVVCRLLSGADEGQLETGGGTA